MQQLVLDIEESRYTLLLQFLKTLDYVRVVQPISNPPVANNHSAKPANQLALLLQVLQQQGRPLFQNIADPVAWQKQQRDEWS